MSLPMPTPSRRRWIPVAVIAAAVLAVGAFVTRGPNEATATDEAEADAIPVVVREVGTVGRPGYVALSGDVEGWRMASVGFVTVSERRSITPA